MKRIVIVGASSGIGRRIAIDFARKGWGVAIAARREEKLKEVADLFPDQIEYEAIDVTAQDAVTRFNNLIERNGGMDVLLFASGVGFANPELRQGLDDEIMAVNVKGFTKIINAAYKYYKNTENVGRGRIAAITSVAGTKGLGIAPTYSASKRYQQTYLQAIDQLAHLQCVAVDVTDIRPGFIRTALLDPHKQYPLTMAVDYAAPLIEKAIERGCRVATIDWRWGLIEGLWRLIPNCIWPLLPIKV
ncbi:MAG: SDR family NAD(P)-dependent oxidoreductase [Bacteroidales bacterium]|nr:SDR family NAD(P)-dependent oxidoreductase [Bacteroidales bacterium]